jgi:hypothetical protein
VDRLRDSGAHPEGERPLLLRGDPPERGGRLSKRGHILALVALAAALGGCVLGRMNEGNSVRFERVDEIRAGATTKAQVLEWFGAPDDASDPQVIDAVLQASDLLPAEAVRIPFSDVFTYRFTEARVRGILLLLWNRFDVRVVHDKLVIFFDEQDRVLYYGFRRETTPEK